MAVPQAEVAAVLRRVFANLAHEECEETRGTPQSDKIRRSVGGGTWGLHSRNHNMHLPAMHRTQDVHFCVRWLHRQCCPWQPPYAPLCLPDLATHRLELQALERHITTWTLQGDEMDSCVARFQQLSQGACKDTISGESVAVVPPHLRPRPPATPHFAPTHRMLTAASPPASLSHCVVPAATTRRRARVTQASVVCPRRAAQVLMASACVGWVRWDWMDHSSSTAACRVGDSKLDACSALMASAVAAIKRTEPSAARFIALIGLTSGLSYRCSTPSFPGLSSVGALCHTRSAYRDKNKSRERGAMTCGWSSGPAQNFCSVASVNHSCFG